MGFSYWRHSPASSSSLCSAAPAIGARTAIRCAGATGLASVVIENYSAM